MKKVRQLCVSRNNKRVFYDPIDSHVATHFDDSPNLKQVVRGVIKDMDLTGEIVAKEIDTKRLIGLSNVVEIDASDNIVYAVRKNREDQGRVPFTKSRTPTLSSKVSLYLIRADKESYELSSAWIGELDSPNFPEMVNATKDSIPYWTKHAFVWGIQEIIPGTEIDSCPW